MTGRNAPRSKNGCTTCRRRKVKCGEERPVCRRCSALEIPCKWGVVKRGRSQSPVHIQPAQPPAIPFAIEQQSCSLDIIPLDPQLDQLSIASIRDTLPEIWNSIPAAFTIPPLCPSPSAPDIECSNSLVLSKQDQKYFQYYPSSSSVSFFIKSWQWSCFNYLYQGPAASSKIVMRMMLALSANDMHRNRLIVRSPGRPTAEDHARYHYGLAVKEFRQLLSTRQGPISQAELEIVFATMFLMISFEWQYGESVSDLQLHLRGVRSLLESQPVLFQDKDVDEVLMPGAAEAGSVSKVSFVPEQLLLWILYIDPGSRPMSTTESLYKYVVDSNNSAIQPDRLYRCARLWGRCFWGKQYPDQEVSDDIENYRALELLHTGMILRHKTWDALADDAVETNYRAESLLKEIMDIRERFSDLFLTVKLAGPASTRRTLVTINMAVSTFFAQVIFHRRLLYPPGPPSTFQRLATTSIIEIMQKQYASDPKLLRRLHWPLLMAVIEIGDASQRDWLRERLLELRVLHSESRWASDVAEDILAVQDASQGRFADVSALLRRRSSG